MMTELGPGSQVIWWKRISREIESPYRAEVVSIGQKRITISVEAPDQPGGRVRRHVPADRLQPVGGYYEKAADQGPAILEPTASWGRFTRYIEVGDDFRAVRQVDAFENGNLLCYDRIHWVDDFGMLGSARLNRIRKSRPWGHSVEIAPDEFEHVWNAAKASTFWPHQVETARMGSLGTMPVWLTIKGRRSS